MAGVLDPSPVGILDPRSVALAQMGMSLLGQGPSRYPVSFGQSLGHAGMQGLNSYMSVSEANRKNAQTQALIDLEKAKAAQTGLSTQVQLAQVNMKRQALGLPPIGSLGGEVPAAAGGISGMGGVGMLGGAPLGGPDLATTIRKLPQEFQQAALADIAMNEGKNLAAIIQKANEPIIGREGGIYERTAGGGMQLAPGWVSGEKQRQRLRQQIENENTIVQEPTGAGDQKRILTKADQLRMASGQLPPMTGHADVLTSVPNEQAALDFVRSQAAQGKTGTAFLNKPLTGAGYVVGKTPQQQAEEDALKNMAEGVGKQGSKVVTDAANSVMNLRNLDQLAALGESLNTGQLEPFKVGVGKWLIGSGLAKPDWVKENITDVPKAEAVIGAVNKIVALAVRQTDAQPAVKQLEMLREAYPQIFQTKEGFQLLTGILRDAHVYNIEKLREQQKFLAKGGKLSDFENHWTDVSEKMPLFKNFPNTPSTPQPIAKPAKKPVKGEVVDGWEFVGGDPSKRMNWRKK